MKKALYKPSWKTNVLGQLKDTPPVLIGFDPGYLWKSVSYFRAPEESGQYLVIKKNGRVKKMYCVGTRATGDKALEPFHAAADGYGDNAYINGEPMTDTDIMNLYRDPYGSWYEFHEWHEYEDFYNDLHVYTEASEEYPLYFLDLNLDSKIELDENGQIKDTEGIQYFLRNFDGGLNGGYVREEDIHE